MEEDKQLARLYDYTKFHIGIYLSSAGGLAALLSADKAGWFYSGLVASNKPSLYLALFFMILAGMCGGVVASSTIECEKFSEFWEGYHGPHGFPRMAVAGKTWAMAEHLCFWASLVVLACTVIGFTSSSTNQAGVDKPQSASYSACR